MISGLHPRPTKPAPAHGSVLILVLWITFGLVSVSLYFAHSMRLACRAADSRLAGLQANYAMEGAVRYVAAQLSVSDEPGVRPDRATYHPEAVEVGEARFWLLGRTDQPKSADEPWFELTDEASKLNLNTATAEMLQWLPTMTPELAAAIVDWRDEDSETSGGAEDEIYQRLNPAYRCKNAAFESVDELRLVYGLTLDLLQGEDANRNGVLDLNENDADQSLPPDNRDGRLDPGLLEYVTVYSREPNTRTNGEPRIALQPVNTAQLTTLLEEKLGSDRANAIVQNVAGQPNGFASPIEFYVRSGMTLDEFAQVETDLTTTNGLTIEGRVNVNTASETVLACLPGMTPDLAATLVAHRTSQSTTTPTCGWVVEAIGATNAIAIGPFITSRSYQFCADIAAVGRHDRGYRREQWILDTTEGTPRAVRRRDLTQLGWALGHRLRAEIQFSRP